MSHNIYLTENEVKAIRALSRYGHYSMLQDCEIPSYGVHLFAAALRRKTGIKNTKDETECKAYLERYEAAMAKLPPTPEQMTLLHHFLTDDTYNGIAYQLTQSRNLVAQAAGKPNEPVEPGDIRRLMDEACEAVGIFTRDDQCRRVQIRIFLASFHAPQSHRKLSPVEEKILRQWADGKHHLEIADEMGERGEYIKYKIKDACQDLGMLAKGRGVQRALVRAYFAQLDAQTGMNDPMF